MSPFVYEITVNLVEALISAIFMVNVLQSRYNKILQIVVWCEATIAVMLLTPSFSILRIVVLTGLEFLYVYFFFEDKNRKRTLLFLIKEGIMVASSLGGFAIYTTVAKEDVSFYLSCRSDNCTYTLLYLLIYSIFISMIFQFTKEEKDVEFPWVMGTLLVMGIGESTAVIAVARSYDGSINSRYSWVVVISMVCMVAANISVGTLAPFLLNKLSLLKNIDYGTQLSNMEYKYYEMSVENDKKLLSLKHDMANHIQTISSLFDSGEHQLGMNFINELKLRYTNINQIVYCNNPVINIILSNKKKEAVENNIDTQINVKIGFDNIPITDFDLSTVICNLLDNAIRGCVCSEQTSPRLTVDILQKNHYLVIRVLNSCKVSMNIQNTERIETSKSNSQTNGFGMPIIAGIAKKYRGDFIASAQNGIFTATVVMSIK